MTLKQRIENRKARILCMMFLSAFFTALVSAASQQGASFLDGMITDRGLGSEALAAVGIAAPCFGIVGFFSGCISSGMRAMCTQNMGNGDIKDTNRIFSEATALGTLLSLCLTVLMLLTAENMAVMLGASGDARNLMEPVAAYIRGFAVGAPAIMLTVIFSTAIQLDNGGSLVKKASTLSLVINCAGDIAAVIFGWGIIGIALATSISSYCSAALMCLHFLKKSTKLRLVLTKPVFADFKTMVVLGSDKLMNSVINVLRPVILNRLVIALGGSIAMTVLTARNNLSGLCEIPSGGIGIAVAIMTGFFFGERNREDILRTGRQAHRMVLVVMIPVSLLLIFFSHPLAEFYMHDESQEAVKLLTFAIICLAIRMPLGALNYSRLQYLQAIHCMKSVRRMTLMLNFVYILAAAFILGELFGAYGIMASFPAADGAMLLSIYLVYAVKCRSLRPTADDYLNLKPDQTEPGENVADFNLKHPNELEQYYGVLGEFAENHHADNKKAEAVKSILKYGERYLYNQAYEPDACAKPVDLRIVWISPEELLIRFRDIGKPVSEELEQKIREDDFENPEIKATVAKLQKVSFMRTLGTNNCTFKL